MLKHNMTNYLSKIKHLPKNIFLKSNLTSLKENLKIRVNEIKQAQIKKS